MRAGVKVRARACANIALTKYWGKQPPPADARHALLDEDPEHLPAGTTPRDAPLGLNSPATPSVSLVLEELWTETTVERSPDGADRLFLDGGPAGEEAQRRTAAYLDLWRARGFIRGRFHIHSENAFPTAAGLASSASGFAALAVALGEVSAMGAAGVTREAGHARSSAPPRAKRLSQAALSRLARQGSGSAARSIPGGLTLLPAGKDPAARCLLPPEQVPWGMVVAILAAEEGRSAAKKVSSREGMEHTRLTSPYYAAWRRQARADTRALLAAIERRDFTKAGRITEANALAMHASMLAARPGLIYWQPATLTMLAVVRRWREAGLEAYMTTDAGPHPILLAAADDLETVADAALDMPGVGGVIASRPGRGARVL